MSGITGIEFGPNSCVLVRARRRGDGIEMSAGHIIEAHRWPEQPTAAAELLKAVRLQYNFPRTARVVPWGLAEGAGPRDPATRAALRPLIAAGFRVESVFSPAQALALLGATRPRGTAAVVLLALNRHAAAMAIVRGAELLYSRAFGWNWEGAAIGSQAQLLQRYSIVAHLAPEVRRGMDLVRSKFGVPVELAVTCGDLPELRSLTMPLIEELDLEVETLDSVEGLIIPPLSRRDHLPDSLAAVRLACAAAAGPATKGISIDLVGVARAAGVVAAVGGLAWVGYVWWARPEPALTPVQGPAASYAEAPASNPPAASIAQKALPPPRTSPRPRASDEAERSGPLAVSTEASSPTQTERPQAPAVRPPPAAPASAPLRSPERSTARRTQPPAAVAGVDVPQSTSGRARDTTVDHLRATQSAPASTAISPAPRRTPPPPVSAPVMEQPAPVTPAPEPLSPPPAVRATPLKEPLPGIETILVSSDRRIAVIDGGTIVSVGDPIGQRTVVRIEVDSIYLREPSGLEIRVPIRVRR